MKTILTVLALLACASAPAHAASTTYTFACLTDTSAENCAVGEAQITMEVSDTTNPNHVLFEFTNTGTAAASITDIYFDDGALLDIAQILNGVGVSFSVLATPTELPGANLISFETTAGFSADSNPPVSSNGVNTGETIGILFDLLPGLTYTNVIDALSLDNGGDNLMVGIHVQSIGSGGSESFVNNIVSPVPEPGQWLMMLSGIMVMAFRAMRRS